MFKITNSICILGSTGSIGTQALKVAKKLNITIDSLSCEKNIDILENQIREFKPKVACVNNKEKAQELKERIKDTKTKILVGKSGICEMINESKAETLLNALCGISGLIPTKEAINSGKNIALANKETLVVAGKIIKNLAKSKNVSILPVDSEHSAIFKCLQSIQSKEDLSKIILTASGGPFFRKTKKELLNVTLKDALNHPSWQMGKKITIDSATMMNKGFEIIEAAHLFDVDIDDIEVIIHRESVVHSMIKLKDNSIIAQLATPSMQIPIQYALTFPHHKESNVESLDFFKYKFLSFYEPDYETFEAIDLCKSAFKNNCCTALNASNEKAVELFLNSKIKFLDIIDLVKFAISKFGSETPKSIDDIISLDKKVRIETEIQAEKITKRRR